MGKEKLIKLSAEIVKRLSKEYPDVKCHLDFRF